MEYKRIFRDGINLLFGQLASNLIGLLNIMILTRILTTEEMGKYSLFIMVASLAIQIGISWTDASVLRHGREEFVKHKKINKSFWARFRLYVPLLLLCITLYTLFYKKISEYVSMPSYVVLLIIMYFFLMSLVSYLGNIYRSIDVISKAAYIITLHKFFYFIGLVLIFFGVIKSNLILIIVILDLSLLLTLIINLIGFDKSVIMPYTFDMEYFKKIWSYSWPQFIGFTGIYIINFVDLHVIKEYMTLSDVGVYNVAYNGFTLITGFILLINTLFLPLIVEYKAKDRYDLIKKYYKKIPLLSLLWLFLVIIGILISDKVIPLFFSQKYVASVPSFKILLIATFFYFIYVCLMPLVNAFDLILYNQIFNVVKAIINIILDYILIPKFGIIGAAYATLISFFIGTILTSLVVHFNKKQIFKTEKISMLNRNLDGTINE
ncbi:MAG: oligosaccharide flippase family protein [Candidatus Woesearchaeota archaeon]